MVHIPFYQNENVVEVAQLLLGKLLFTNVDGQITGGYISETESYAGVSDRASHAYNGRRTLRTEIMYAPGGVAYVYLCYGIHHLLNVITSKKDEPHAVLIRALVPVVGKEIMLQRRKRTPLANGPGTLTQALGITMKQNGLSFQSDQLWIEEGIQPESIAAGPRVGVGYAGPDAFLPYRFIAKFGKMGL